MRRSTAAGLEIDEQPAPLGGGGPVGEQLDADLSLHAGAREEGRRAVVGHRQPSEQLG